MAFQILIILFFLFLLARLMVAAYNYHSSPKLFLNRHFGGELVSILIPARNEAENLPVILNSIRSQKYLKYENI